jgi:hypothetical protein
VTIKAMPTTAITSLNIFGPPKEIDPQAKVYETEKSDDYYFTCSAMNTHILPRRRRNPRMNIQERSLK